MRKFLTLSVFVCFISAIFLGCQKENEFINPDPPVADAGVSQVIALPIPSFILTGTGTTSNGSIVGYLWSLVSGPNVPTITSPSSATTTVSNLVEGTYVFQFMVIDEAGLTGIDTTQVILTPAPIQTLTLQPANNPNERHLWGNANQDQSTNAPELDAGSWTSGGEQVGLRGLFKFDLSSIPATATILSAKLTLYSNPTPLNGTLTDPNLGPANAMYIQRVTGTWNPPTTQWLNQPAATNQDQVSIPHTSLPLLDLVDIDVLDLVSAMHSGSNNGFRIVLQNETPYNLRTFCSSTYSNASKHPKLVITYTP